MSEQVIKLSDNAVSRIKEIMSKADGATIGVRVGVKSGGCAGMSYVMEYTKEANPNDEVIEDKGVKVFIDPKSDSFEVYKNSFIVTPNRKEFEAVVGKCLNEKDIIRKAIISYHLNLFINHCCVAAVNTKIPINEVAITNKACQILSTPINNSS